MKLMFMAIVTALAVTGGIDTITGPIAGSTSMESMGEIPWATCDEEALLWEPPAGMILAAARDSGKYKCLDNCARARHRCEQQDINRPGSKANIEWSRECQRKYTSCMEKCE